MGRPEPSPAAPLFVLSSGARDALAAVAAGAGWRAIAARRRDMLERRFVASGAQVGIVDLRGALLSGLDALRRLGGAAEAQGAVLVALIDAGDRARLDEIGAAGATLYLVAPFEEAELIATLGFAQRLMARIAAGRTAPRALLPAPEAAGWRWRPATRTVRLSAALAQRIGIVGDSVSLIVLLRRLGKDGRRAARETVRRLLATGHHGAFAHDSGGERLVHHLGIDEATGEVTGWIEDLDGAGPATPLPSRDPLTGLADAGAAHGWIVTRLAPPGDGGLVLLRLAVSRFDMINAAFGREAGDALLQGVARRIARLAGTGMRDRLIARLAGAEYLVGLAAASAEEAAFLGARLVDAIAQPFMFDDHLVTLSARVGIAAAGAGDDDPDALLRRAAAALADAQGGDAAVSTLDAAGSAAAERDSRLEIDLRRALDGDEIALLFQPQVDVTTGRIVGAEALARWQHPRLGRLGAAELFAAAERSDYLLELSAHVQRRAIAAVAAWGPRLGACRVAINVTPADMAQPGFADGFAAMVDAGGVARSRVTIEVTETSLIEDLGVAAALLADLRERGFRVALDDFGTGYSSLAYLKALPLDYLKIDKRLSDDIVGSPRDRVVVRSVIDMARALGLTVIAEGVESEAQLALLAAEGCNLYQGFLCAPPLTSAALARLVARSKAGGGA